MAWGMTLSLQLVVRPDEFAEELESWWRASQLRRKKRVALFLAVFLYGVPSTISSSFADVRTLLTNRRPGAQAYDSGVIGNLMMVLSCGWTTQSCVNRSTDRGTGHAAWEHRC
ncbi:unnamed protein product [Pleuronectes platessa]|uniref:Uncharacterized protein n=1 Tax=Pleuronectes platessa TaxID=8262 RepID=A0A9N7V3M7_PLEPL|nr:unnamed protein product [Pleuronectes platessa]